MVWSVKYFGVLLSQFVQVDPLHLNQKSTDGHPGGIFRGCIMWRNGINGTASVKLSEHYRVIPGAVVYIDHAGHDSLRYVGANEDTTPLVEYIDHISVLNASPLGFRRVNPDGLVEVSVRTPDFTSGDFMEPINVIEVGMYQAEMGEAKESFLVGRGCNFCARSGFLGRIGTFELLTVNDEIRKMLVQGTPASVLREEAIRGGMVPIRTDAMQKVKDGVTTAGEAMRNVFTVL